MYKAKKVFEFERGQSPSQSLGIGNEKKKRWMAEHFPYKRFKLTDEGKIQTELYSYRNENYFEDFIGKLPSYIKFEFERYLVTPELNKVPWKFIEHSLKPEEIKDEEKVQAYWLHKILYLLDKERKSPGDAEVEETMENLSDESLKSRFAQKIFAEKPQLLMDIVKHNKSEEEAEMDEIIGFYFFIGRDEFKETIVGDEKYHKKQLHIENLVQIDRYNKGDLMQLSMMKIRVASQGEGSVAWVVQIPKFMHDEKYAYNDAIDAKLRKYIDENKYKI